LHADPRDPAAEDEEDRPTFPFTIGPAVHQILIRDYGDGDGLCTEIRTRRDLVRPESVSRQPPFPRELPWVTPHNCLQLKNNSGGNLVPGRVLEVGDKLYSEPTRWGAFFDGNVPDPDGADNVAVNLRRMDTSGSTNIDWCQIYGLVKCKLIVNHIQHVYADVDASSTILQSKWHGRARIVWVSDPGNTGEQDAWVLLGEMFRGPIKGIATEDIPECGSGDVKVQWAGEDADPLSTVEVHYNWMSLGTIAAGTELLFEWFPDEQKYVVVELACSPTSCA
jgi:hypothetical protein